MKVNKLNIERDSPLPFGFGTILVQLEHSTRSRWIAVRGSIVNHVYIIAYICIYT